MKLNPDCVRDVLLYLESNLEYVDRGDCVMEHTHITFETIATDLSLENTYTKSEIKYATEKLLEVGFISANTQSRGRNNSIIYAPISDITWQGHQFLNNIRKQSIWEATKAGAAKIGVTSISALSTIAMEIIKAIVTKPEIINNIISSFQL